MPLNMASSVRFCLIATSRNTGGNSESEKMYKFLVYETYAADRWNSSLVTEDQAQNCFDKMKNNETDIFPYYMDYLMHSDIVDYITLVTGSPSMIISSFLPVNQTEARIESTQCLSSLNSFTPTVVTLICLFLLLFYSLLRCYCTTIRAHKVKMHDFNRMKAPLAQRQAARRRSMTTRTPMNILIGWFLKQFTSCAAITRKRSSFKLISILLIGFLSSIHFMFSAFTRTQMVIVDEPLIFDSYPKILHHPKAMPTWVADTNGHYAFEIAENGSLEHQLWQKHRRLCLQQAAGDCLTRLKVDTVTTLVNKLSNQEVVLLAGSYLSSLMHAALCPLSDTMRLNPIVLRRNKNGKSKPQALTYAHAMLDFAPHVVKVIMRRGLLTAQSGIVLKLTIPMQSPLSFMVSPESVRRCLNNEVRIREYPTLVYSKPFADFQSLFLTCSTFFILSLALHLTLLRHIELAVLYRRFFEDRRRV